MEIISNKPFGTVLVHATANGTLVVAGNSSVSEIAIGPEIVTGASIKQVWFGSPSGANAYWTVKRGNNVVAVLDSTAYVDYAGNGCSLIKDADGDLTVELTGSTVGYIMLDLKKITQRDDI